MAHHGIGAGKAELLLDVTNARPEAVAPFVMLDKSEDFLLSSCEIFHSVHLFR